MAFSSKSKINKSKSSSSLLTSSSMLTASGGLSGGSPTIYVSSPTTPTNKIKSSKILNNANSSLLNSNSGNHKSFNCDVAAASGATKCNKSYPESPLAMPSNSNNENHFNVNDYLNLLVNTPNKPRKRDRLLNKLGVKRTLTSNSESKAGGGASQPSPTYAYTGNGLNRFGKHNKSANNINEMYSNYMKTFNMRNLRTIQSIDSDQYLEGSKL